MKVTLTILILLAFSGCELLVIGSKKAPPIPVDQTSPIGVVLLFKTELDSNNIPAATQVLAKTNNSKYLAYEQYELYDEIARIGRILKDKPITNIVKDSLAPTRYVVNVEFDYLKNIDFTTTRINKDWFIVHYEEKN